MGKYTDPAYGALTYLRPSDTVVWHTAAGTKSATLTQVRGSVYFNVLDYGATGDATTNDTVAIQAANDAAAAVNGVVFFPPGTYLISQVTMSTNVTWLGSGKFASVIKRNASTAATSMVACTTIHGFRIEKLGFDGNKANNANPAHNITVSASCYDWRIVDCSSTNAKKTGAGYGSGVAIVDGVDATNSTASRITGCVMGSNDDAGIYISKASYITASDNHLVSNGGDGVQVINYVFPPVSNVHTYITVANNTCKSNGNAGINFAGFTIGGTAGTPFPGYTVPPSKGVVIDGNQCTFNTKYGIIFQGQGGMIVDNHCERNGDSTSNGGMLANGWLCTITGNSLYDNYFYGCDMGGAASSVFANNVVSYNGLTSGAGAVGLNIGGTTYCSVVGNTFDSNGTTGSPAINLSGYESGSTGYFPNIGTQVKIADNTIHLPVVGAVGILFKNGFDNAIVSGNQCSGGNANQAYQLGGGFNGFSVRERDNIDWTNGATLPVLASVAALVIPDVGDQFLISGTTSITSIQTYSSNLYNATVRYIQMTNAGSGYTVGAPPAVTFTGGGGTGAAGTALIANDGTCIGVNMTNLGSGYTSAPTVAFGSGAAAGVARIGCDNFDGRVITLMFSGVLTFTSGGNLSINGNLVTSGGSSTITLRGSYGNWYELSRRS